MGKKSSGSQSVENKPYEGAVPFLVGGGDFGRGFLPKELRGVDVSNLPGVFPEAARLYTQFNTLSPDQENLQSFQLGILGDRVRTNNDILAGARRILTSSDFDPNLRASNIVTGQQVSPTSVSPGMVQAADVNLEQARANQGGLDPTAALARVLSGQVDTRHFDPQIENIINLVNRNTGENLLPQIRSGALTSGSFGGSRQGIAEGLAISRSQGDIAQGIAPIIGQAHENAKSRQASLANILNQQAVDTETGNVNRGFTADVGNVERQFRSDTGNADREAKIDLANAMIDLQAQNQNNQNIFQGNAQQMQALNQILNNKLTGLNVLGQGQNFQDLNYQQALELLGLPQTQATNALNQYAGIVQHGAGLGGSSTSTTNSPRNPLSGLVGGGLAGATLFTEGGALAGLGGMTGPWGAAIGAGLGLLTQLF